MIADIADVEATRRIELDTMRLIQFCGFAGTAIAKESLFTGPRHGGNNAIRVHAADQMIAHLHEIHISHLVETHFVRLIQWSVCRVHDERAHDWDSVGIKGEMRLSRPGDSFDNSICQNSPNAMIGHITEIENAVR